MIKMSKLKKLGRRERGQNKLGKKKQKFRKKIEFNFNDNFIMKLIWFDVYYKYTSVFKLYK